MVIKQRIDFIEKSWLQSILKFFSFAGSGLVRIVGKTSANITNPELSTIRNLAPNNYKYSIILLGVCCLRPSYGKIL